MSKMRWCQSHQPLVSDESTPRYHCKHLKWDPFSSCFTLLWDVCCLKWIIASLNCEFFSRFSISMCARNKHKLSPHWKWKREPAPETQDGWVVFFWAESQIQLGEKKHFFFFRQMTRLGTKCANAVLTDLLCVILWACVCVRPAACVSDDGLN